MDLGQHDWDENSTIIVSVNPTFINKLITNSEYFHPQDENSTIIVSVNPTFINIKLIIFSSFDHFVPNLNAEMKITPCVSMLLVLGVLLC